jgi:hypothetical protein
MSANPNFNLPSGWQQAAAGYNVVGQLIMRDTGTDEFFGFIKGNGVGTTNCLLKTSKVGATYGQTDVMNGTIPFTWTTSDELMFTALFPVTAV